MSIEQTLSIIKPDATKRNLTGKINSKLEDSGLKIIAQKRILLSKTQAEDFYKVHQERPFYNDLVKFMISGPVVVQVLEGENAVSKNREVMGATNPDEAENFYYFGTYDVDFNKRTELDVKDMTAPEANKEIDNLMSQGYGTIVIKNPQGKHSLGVGILNKLNLIFEGSLGYFGMGSCDGPIVRINGRVGWSCAENLMAGKVVIEKNAGSCFGAAIRGGDLICKGSVGARTGIDMKGGTIIIGGDAGAFTGFMMQRGRIIILGDVGINLGDSMYDGTIFVGGEIGSYGSDAVDSELTKSDQDWLRRKLRVAEIGENFDVSKMKKIVAGKKLWNYDNLEPAEKKGAI